MCGYIAGPLKTLKEHGVKQLLQTQKHRGTDGYGLFEISNGKIGYYKTMSLNTFAKYVNKLRGNPYLIIHHRATSVGGTKLELAHPLVTPDKKVLLMQNGTKRPLATLMNIAESDSQALAYFAHSLSPQVFNDLILEDVGVVFFIKNRRIYLHRDTERPLLLNKDTGIISSEPVTTGNHTTIDIGFYQLEIEDNQLIGFDTFGEVVVEDMGKVAKCPNCNKSHYIPEGKVYCHVCVAEGKTQHKELPFYDDPYGWDYTHTHTHTYDPYIYDPYGRVTNTQKPTFGNTVYKISGSQHATPEKTEVMVGTPVKINGEMYLKKSESGLRFLVEPVDISVNKSRFIDNTWLPKGTIMHVNTDELFEYWREDIKAYDLMDEIYYMSPTDLDISDKNKLQYNIHMGAYAVPYEYDYGMPY